MKPGGEIEIFGPLGSGYDISRVKGNKIPVLIAGGTGIASLSFLAEVIKTKGVIFYGARTKGELVGVDRLRKLGWQVETATDDGSNGFKGFVTDLCEGSLNKMTRGDILMFCCGPRAMLKKCKELAIKYNIEGCASLEEMMACGTGNCQGCVAKIAGEYRRVCADGPVFELKDIEYEN
jgi:dihydroorotate dehydrogenase electron transfer subunit